MIHAETGLDALTVDIAERASSLADRRGDAYAAREDLGGERCVADRRLDLWCNVVTVGRNSEVFAKRLRWAGLDEAEVREALGSVRLKNPGAMPSWTDTFQEVLHRFENSASDSRPLTPESGDGEPVRSRAAGPMPFRTVVYPFVEVAREKLQEELDEDLSLLSDTACQDLEHALLQRLCRVSRQALEAEYEAFQAARPGSDPDATGEMTGRCAFAESMFESGNARAFFQTYSVLSRLLAVAAEQWVAFCAEFLRRVRADRSELERVFDVDTIGKITAARPNLQETHHDGRTVIIATFEPGLTLVYKPHTLHLDQAYNQFLAELRERGAPVELKALKTLSRPTHGWAEFVETAPRRGAESWRRYYRRAGALACVLYVLDATDCHADNVIASGEHPVLIDTETLLHHRLSEGKPASSTILRSHLVAFWVSAADGETHDFSGITGSRPSGPQSDSRQPASPEPEDASRPDRSPRHDELRDQAILEGFTDTYEWLLDHRDALLAPGGPLELFADQNIRFVFRFTSGYATLLRKSLQPRYLKSGVERSIRLDGLSKSMLSSPSKPAWWPLLRHEVQALEELDVPHFSGSSSSAHLRLPGGEVIEDCFEGSSYERVVDTVGALSRRDLSRQRGYLRAALRASTKSPDESPDESRAPALLQPIPGASATIDRFEEMAVEQAVAIADVLKASAIDAPGGGVAWVARHRDNRRWHTLRPMPDTLSGGTCGVALFLAATARVADRPDLGRLALEALAPLRRSLATGGVDAVERWGIGGGVGCGSVVYALAHAGTLLDEPALLRDVEQVAGHVTSRDVRSDTEFDVFGGVAGALLGLLTVHEAIGPESPSGSALLDRARQCGDVLLQKRRPQASGHRVWHGSGNPPRAGFAHGQSGIAHALMRLHARAPDDAYRDAAVEALDYEHEVWSHQYVKTLDFSFARSQNDQRALSWWCAGAPGMALARVAAGEGVESASIREAACAALNSLQQLEIRERDHLCCGNAGAIEALHVGGRRLGRRAWVDEAKERAVAVVKRAAQNGTFAFSRHAPPTSVLQPSLFKGSAGVGYTLLRFVRPDLVPCVLLWE